jgi:hypothetical protein
MPVIIIIIIIIIDFISKKKAKLKQIKKRLPLDPHRSRIGKHLVIIIVIPSNTYNSQPMPNLLGFGYSFD